MTLNCIDLRTHSTDASHIFVQTYKFSPIWLSEQRSGILIPVNAIRASERIGAAQTYHNTSPSESVSISLGAFYLAYLLSGFTKFLKVKPRTIPGLLMLSVLL